MKLVDAPNSCHTAPEALENGFLSDFTNYLLVLHAIYSSLDLTCCCLHPTGGSLRHAIHIYLLVNVIHILRPTSRSRFTFSQMQQLLRSLRSNNKKPASKQLDQESAVGNLGTAPCNSLVPLRQFKTCIQPDGRCGYIFSNALQSTSILSDILTVETDFC